MLVEPADLLDGFPGVVFDCRFSLADPQEGRRFYLDGHIPGAHYLDLNIDLAGAVEKHGGRHPLPKAADFAAILARSGVGRDTAVLAYDDSRLAFASRLWWMMRSLGFKPPRLLNGGYRGYLQAGGKPTATVVAPEPAAPVSVSDFRDCCDIEAVRKAAEDDVLLVDSREPARYRGEQEPIDPVAGHIPGAVNRPWQNVTDDQGRVLSLDDQRVHWGDALEAEQLLLYCGSGVTACVNLFSLALLGREDAKLYAGSWSDWCSYLQE
jgi:thiosulfate/3-mercaptopyruvate sulfurtransferase